MTEQNSPRQDCVADAARRVRHAIDGPGRLVGTDVRTLLDAYEADQRLMATVWERLECVLGHHGSLTCTGCEAMLRRSAEALNPRITGGKAT